MTEWKTWILGRYGRYVWGGAAALLLLVLVASFPLSGSSVSGAEREAQQRAERLASSVVGQQLTLDLLTRDLNGSDYRDLTAGIEAGILSDDRFEVVRLWRLDGDLIYSTTQLDDVNDVAAPDDRWIQQALGGRTVSVASSAGTDHEGLKRPDEELFQTFVPIRLTGDAVDGVVEMDQRYDAIHDQAYRLWRPVQIVAFLLLIGAGIMLVRTFRGGVTYGEGGIERRQSPGRRADDRSVRDAADRADRAERRVRETQKRVAELEAQLARAPSTATATAALEELDLKLRASEAEREELAATIKRLRAELAESQAEVTLARQGSTATPAETRRVNKLIADAESKTETAERKAALAEQKSLEAAKRASMSAEHGLELEAQLREAQKVAEDAQKPSDGVDHGESGVREVAAELELAEGERDHLVFKLDELERALAEAEARAEASERELAVKGVEPAVSADATASLRRLEEARAAFEEPEDEEFAEGPSLRERLSRAAAARKRLG